MDNYGKPLQYEQPGDVADRFGGVIMQSVIAIYEYICAIESRISLEYVSQMLLFHAYLYVNWQSGDPNWNTKCHPDLAWDSNPGLPV